MPAPLRPLLQNLIQRGHSSTMLTALRCTIERDAGPIYMKQALSLQGSAEEIFLRADALIEAMIGAIPRQRRELGTSQGWPDRHGVFCCLRASAPAESAC